MLLDSQREQHLWFAAGASRSIIPVVLVVQGGHSRGFTTSQLGNLPITLMKSYPAQKKRCVSLKAYVYDYRGINQCFFAVKSISDPIDAQEPLQLEAFQPQPPQPQRPKTLSNRTIKESSGVSSFGTSKVL
ncbi:hypothetical protein RHMOL_Rhmol12G0025200 [Rhododendron molle]|uniref:Uncharacterized protein n=1 Tax=Rhododendron molle TaxID=49168 RepID=A0ACC0LDG8_RHOML|nr:hypothetical protein RHMOL_Rhmol12G0025200 [Rhododendron molle]